MKITIKNGLFSLLFVFSGLFVHGTPLEDSIRRDAGKVGEWFSREVAHATSFNAATGLILPGDVHGILGVEVGVSAAVSSTKIDNDEFNLLPLEELETARFDMVSRLPMAMPLVHGKVGLPYGLDLGGKYGSVSFSDSRNGVKSEISNTVFGVEVRRRLMGEGVTGVVLPDVALSVAYDHADGDITRTERYVGATGSGTLSADTTLASEWNTGAVTARLLASKQIAFVTPFIGAGYSWYTGDADTTMKVVGNDTGAGAVDVTSVSSGKAHDQRFQISGGAQVAFFPTLHLNLGGLYADKDWSATLGVLFQFR